MRSRHRFEPLSRERWKDFEKLFGPRGACAGCWCMFFRLRRKDWTAGQGDGNKRKMKSLVARGAEPGLIAYAHDEPVGWCAIAPRDEYPVLANSRVLAPVDAERVWSVTCFYVAKEHRGRGLTVELLEAAVQFARERGARLIEGYPNEPKSGAMAAAFAFQGLASAFRSAGFREVARRSPTRPIMRRTLRGERRARARL
jgi:GNAT superfamily N-acetyltransferase